MPLYSGQILRVDQATGTTSATYMTVSDNDNLLQSQEAGTVYDLCGTDLPQAPVIDSRTITGTLLDGSAYSYTVGHFVARGKDFYILPAACAPEAVASVTTSTSAAPLTPFPYFSHGLTYEDQPLFTGLALTALLTRSGRHNSVGTDYVAVMDDDGLVQFDGTNGTINTETGATAEVLFGAGPTSYSFNQTENAMQMALVKLTYQSQLGTGSLTALYYSIETNEGTREYFLPKNGTVDLLDIDGISHVKIISATPEGISYTKLGLDGAETYRISGESGQFIQGLFTPDFMQGNGGDDTLVGGMGADRIDGGTGNDILHGGAQDDNMKGREGNDAMYGGNDHDRMDGGDGDDMLTGNWGNDTLLGGSGNDRLAAGSDNDALYGGAGNDSLIGFDGNDRLQDGSGADVLDGGLGADVFVLAKDGTLDRIADFEDGIDHIDLNLTFDSLTITTVKPGQVQIDTGTDILVVFDTAHILTATAFTAADFL